MHDKKEQIFEATLSLFKEGNTLSNIKVIDIAKKANIGKGTVYEYFDSKDEIFAKSVTSFAQKQKKVLISAIDSVENCSFKEIFYKIMQSVNKIIIENRPLFGMMLLSARTYKLNSEYEDLIKSELLGIKKEIVNVIIKVVLKGQQEKIISTNVEEKDIMFAFLAISSTLNHYNEKKQNCLREAMTFEQICDFCYEKFVKILS
ncbi:TetR/AcrR family transcriptional regulator [Sedimentibacter sp. zth1]|uniref:TetR/AcrR family transcriptional regulator n=1 Tax=Sedimentibacter sp. zth1 TaxID=2816908 RepID=UPI001A938EA8|nr:TetR/AcrR family transcriptional regulator [Sedimentibacter sp. zth1]QSX05507.1 TetR/AcrR family transcriptional regulator [Sedimentibacter sp. zth1]